MGHPFLTVFNQKNGLFFTFFAANDADWNAFGDFRWNTNRMVLQDGSSTSGHTVLLVGYNDDAGTTKRFFWIALNRWGTVTSSPVGICCATTGMGPEDKDRGYDVW